MAIAKVLPIVSLTLSALFGSSLASGHIGRRQPLLGLDVEVGVGDVEVGLCLQIGWVPACPGTFACAPPGSLCCSDDLSYALPPETCPEDTHPLPVDEAGSGTEPQDAPDPAATHPVDYIPDTDHDVDFLGSSSGWYTFALTSQSVSHWYTLHDHTSSVLVSAKVTSYTTVSVSATDAAEANDKFSSYTASAVAAAAPTETYVHTSVHTVLSATSAQIAAPLESVAPVQSAAPVDSAFPVENSPYETASPVESGAQANSATSVVYLPVPGSTSTWKPKNETVGTATRLPTPIVTAGAQRVGAFGPVGAALAVLAVGMVVAFV